MVEGHCEICGKATRKVLLEDASAKIYICSERCENEYFETLHGQDKELKEVLRYLDKKIAKVKKYELFCWIVALLGVAIILLGIFLVNVSATKEQIIGPFFFVAGVVPLTGSLLATSQLSKEEEKLLQKRKQLGLEYSY